MAYALSDVGPPIQNNVDLWIGSIPFETTEATLKKVLERHVPVISLKIIRDHLTRQSRGFGFVTVGSEQQALLLLTLHAGAIKIGRRSLIFKPAHKQKAKEPDFIRPGHKDYTLHQPSTEPYDLEPSDPRLPCGHILVDDIMLTLFQMFSHIQLLRLELVCRRWQGLIYRILGGQETIDFRTANSPWGALSCRYSWYHKHQLLCLYKALIMNSDSVTGIMLDDIATFDSSALNAIGQVAPNLELLSIKCVEKTTRLSLKSVIRGCPYLKHIHIDGSFHDDNYVDELEKAKCLESFSVRGTSQITTSRFEKLPNTLTEICLDEACGNLVETFPSSIICFPNLKKLKFISVDDYGPRCLRLYSVGHLDLGSLLGRKGFKMVTQEHLDQLADGCPLLEDLQINVSCTLDQAPNFTKFLNLNSLRVFAERFNLKTFLLSCIPPVTDLRIKFKSLSQLEVLDLDFSQAPSSIQSLTLNRVSLASQHFDSIMKHPSIKNFYIKNSDLSLDALKQLLSSLSFVELGVHLDPDVEISELECVTKVRNEVCRESVKSGTTIATPPRLLLHVYILLRHHDEAFFSSLNSEYLTVKGYDEPNFMRFGSPSISDTELSYDHSGSGLDDDDDDEENYFDDLDYEDYLGDSDDDVEGLLQIMPINLLDDENDKYLFGYGDPDNDGDYYLGHWD